MPVLENAVARLEPLSPRHLEGLRRAADAPRDSFALTTVPTPATAEEYLRASLARTDAGECWSLAQLDAATGEVVGHTSYLSPRWFPDGRLLAVEIGHTWLTPSVQGTAFNTAAKLLLAAHAFETWGVARLDLKTDARNARSRAAIQAIGARFEGVLRNWQPSAAEGEEGLPRDTAMHAITAADWPEVKRMLEQRLAAKLAAAQSAPHPRT